LRYFSSFQNTAQSKQSPKGRKFAQSGHPDFRAAARPRKIFFGWKNLFSLKIGERSGAVSFYFEKPLSSKTGGKQFPRVMPLYLFTFIAPLYPDVPVAAVA
jgi:hypothetical protein